MSLTRISSQFALDSTERTPAYLPQENPLINRSGKGRKTLHGIYDNNSFYSTEYTGPERAQLFNDCTLELPGRRDGYGIEHPVYIEPHALKVVEGLWMSDQYTATDERALRALGVTHIVSVHDSYTLPRFPERLVHGEESGRIQVRSVYWPATTQRAPSVQRLEEQKRQVISAKSWIQELLMENRNRETKRNVVLVHSKKGQRRAALVVLAALVPLMGSNTLEPCLMRLGTLWSPIVLDESTRRILEEFTAGVPSKSVDASDAVRSMFCMAYDTRTGQETSTTGPYIRPSPKVVREVHFELPPPPMAPRPIRRDNSANYSAVVYPELQTSASEISEGSGLGRSRNAQAQDDLGGIVEEEEDDTETEVGDPYDVGLTLEPTLVLDDTIGPDPEQPQATLSVQHTETIFVGKTPFTTPAGSFAFAPVNATRMNMEDAVWRLSQLPEQYKE